mmetsp:Transcript_6682/g.13793  ORF Transcript_6682/g.13793 Transcript_6682/m.13793 type:complete len:126 (-) Transcript_6682:48-425(-)
MAVLESSRTIHMKISSDINSTSWTSSRIVATAAELDRPMDLHWASHTQTGLMKRSRGQKSDTSMKLYSIKEQRCMEFHLYVSVDAAALVDDRTRSDSVFLGTQLQFFLAAFWEVLHFLTCSKRKN